MDGYTDTILVDCNRLNSEEKKGGNTTTPALFTNKIGNGLKLNVGDKVSVHSGFISERGAGGSVIELTGKKLNYTYELDELELNLYQPRYAVAIDGSNHTGRMGELQPFNHHCNTYTPITRTYQLQDNIGHMQINYYKTTNGEGYFHLPRRFDAEKAPYDENPIDLWRNSATHPTNPAPDGEYSPDDGIPSVPYWYSLYNSNTANQQSNGYNCDSYTNGRPMTNWAYEYNRCLDDIEYYNLPGIDQFEGVPSANASRFYKKKNDNSRYTIFVKEISYWAEWRCIGKFIGDPEYLGKDLEIESVAFNETASRSDLAENGHFNHNRDPALSGYVRYNEIKEVTIDTLHSAPENIADNITNQLNQVVTDKPIRGEVGGTFVTNEGTAGQPLTKYVGRETRNTLDYYSVKGMPGYSAGQQSLRGIDIGRKVESECFKTFPCANARTYDKSHYQAYWQDKSAEPQIESSGRNAADLQDKVQNYLSAYSTIGVKRSDLFEVGREVAAMSPGKNGGVAINGVGADNTLGGDLVAWRDMWNPWIMNTAVVNVDQSPTSVDLTGVNRGIADVILSYEWTDANLKLLKRYFDTQAKYPELWTGYNGGNAGEWNSEYKKEGLLNSNSRFWHMAPLNGTYSDEDNAKNDLGSDNYENVAGTTPTTATFVNKQSIPLFFYFDESRSEIAGGGNGVNDLYYGMFIKRTSFFPTDTPANRYDVIGVTTEKIGGVPDYFWGQGADIDESPPAPGDGDRIGGSFSRPIGVDIHFNAYGTDAICLYSGLLDATPLNKDPEFDAGIPKINATPNEFPNQVYYAHDEAQPQPTMDQGWYQVSTQIRERYCGANQVAMDFDTTASRFNFKLLHTPENIGNSVQAGFPATAAGVDDAVSELEGAKNPVIKINKRLFPIEYCPDMKPYTSTFGAKFFTQNKGGATDGNAEGENIEDPYNSNMSDWSIFDSDCGIFIDNFGISEEQWENSLWGILGFSYNQFNSATTLNRQTRITNSVVQDNIGAVTTNANLNSAEVKKFVSNINGAPLFGTSIGTLSACNFQNYAPDWGHMPPNRDILPAITIDALSAQVNAQNLPRKMLSPYFLIKSSIIGDVSFLGGADSGQALPVMYVINKENGFGDFYFQGQSQNEFTITKSKTITEITTSIHNADFELAPVDENSAIIYKITKQIPANMNVAEEVMKKLKK